MESIFELSINLILMVLIKFSQRLGFVIICIQKQIKGAQLVPLVIPVTYLQLLLTKSFSTTTSEL